MSAIKASKTTAVNMLTVTIPLDRTTVPAMTNTSEMATIAPNLVKKNCCL